MIRRILITFILSFGALVFMYTFYVEFPRYVAVHFGFSKQVVKNKQFVKPLILPSPLPTPGLAPVTVIIPKLGLKTKVEAVGLTQTNNMDVPKNAAHLAWYTRGLKPSEEGNAVIAGHFDTPAGRPAVFYHLRTLEAGDEIEVVSENGVHSTFIVTEKSTIPIDVFPGNEVLKTKPGKNLNLITNAGVWDAKRKAYSDRVVVYSTLKEVNK